MEFLLSQICIPPLIFMNNSSGIPWNSTSLWISMEVYRIRLHGIPYSSTSALAQGLWCGSPSHRYFCTTKIGYPVFPRSPIPLAKMLRLMRGNDWLEEIQIGSKLTEI